MELRQQPDDSSQPVAGGESESAGENPGLIQPPTISLPTGGGAIRGIGEKFATNPVTGTGSMSVPIATSPGRAGFGPELTLSYDSGAGNGPFGFGWSLSLPAITRKTDKGLPRHLDAEESDVFLLASAEDLVPVQGADGNQLVEDSSAADYTIHRFRPRIEGLFARIECWSRKRDGDVHWLAISRDNVSSIYGKDAISRIADPYDSGRIFSWLICETHDEKGQCGAYGYTAEDGTRVEFTRSHERNRGERDDPRRTANRYIKRIHYRNRKTLLSDGVRTAFLSPDQIDNTEWMFEVVQDYGKHRGDVPTPRDASEWAYRDDPFSSYRAGFEVRTTRICQRVLMFHHFDGEEAVGNDCMVRSTDFTYSHDQDPSHASNPVYTLLRAVTQTGYKGDGRGYRSRGLPPVEFEYSKPVVQDTIEELLAEEVPLEEVSPDSLENVQIGLDGTVNQWTDLHGERLPGMLAEQADAWYYKRNLTPVHAIEENGVVHTRGIFAPLEQIASKPSLTLAGGAQLMDLAGGGEPDLVILVDPMPGVWENDSDESWESFVRQNHSKQQGQTGLWRIRSKNKKCSPAPLSLLK